MSGPQTISYFSEGAKYDLKSCVDRYTSPGERLPGENIQIITLTTGSASNLAILYNFRPRSMINKLVSSLFSWEHQFCLLHPLGAGRGGGQFEVLL